MAHTCELNVILLLLYMILAHLAAMLLQCTYRCARRYPISASSLPESTKSAGGSGLIMVAMGTLLSLRGFLVTRSSQGWLMTLWDDFADGVVVLQPTAMISCSMTRILARASRTSSIWLSSSVVGSRPTYFRDRFCIRERIVVIVWNMRIFSCVVSLGTGSLAGVVEGDWVVEGDLRRETFEVRLLKSNCDIGVFFQHKHKSPSVAAQAQVKERGQRVQHSQRTDRKSKTTELTKSPSWISRCCRGNFDI